MSKQSVLFLCAHNAARSQIAEALLRQHAGDRFDVMSAGLEPTTIHPLTVRALNEISLDVSHQRCKGLDGILGNQTFQFAVFVCERTQQNCPTFIPSRCNGSLGRLKTQPLSRARKKNNCRSSGKSVTKSRLAFWNGSKEWQYLPDRN
jgi:protein-tyrosine-phosphatase